MTWDRISTKTLIVIGIAWTVGALIGEVIAAYLHATHGDHRSYLVHQATALCLWSIVFGVMWTIDAFRCHQAEKALARGDRASAEGRLDRVRMLPRKAESIRQRYGLVRPWSDPGRPLGLG